MGVSWTRIAVRKPIPTTAALRKEIVPLLDAYGKIGVEHVKTKEWARSRFKKPTGRSTNAWKFLVNKDRLYLTIYNDASNRYGTRYVPYVHLAGRPKANKLFAEVETYTGGELAASIGRATTNAYIRLRKNVPSKTTITRWG